VQWPPPGLVISKAMGYRVKRKRMQRLMRQVGLAAQN
jgi:ribonuclease P protein component